VTEEALGPFSMHVCVDQWRGAAYIQRGDFETGHPLAKAGSEYWAMSGGGVCTAMFRSWIVHALQGLGRIDEAAALNTDSIAHCRETGDRYMEPECVRLQGELTWQAATPNLEAVERLFRQAVHIAQEHGAKSWELRGAMSLARYLQARHRLAEARACLEPVLNWFTEGLETADLRQASSLLAELE
jgi:predicted ATPase